MVTLIPTQDYYVENVGQAVEGLTCEELVGEVNHTTECVTDLFSFVDMDNSVIYFKLLLG